MDFGAAIQQLGVFLDKGPLTESIGSLELALDGKTQADIPDLLGQAGVTPELLRAAILVRARLGRISDVIHAAAIGLVLNEVLEDGEVLARPSLGAGNDPSRPFDLETSHRVAEFKLAGWKGSDAARKRLTFKDLVHLAAEDSDRVAQLYVVGEQPIHFLETSKAKARWGLDRFPASAALFEKRFGSLDMSISEFSTGLGSDVEIVNLESLLPEAFAT